MDAIYDLISKEKPFCSVDSRLIQPGGLFFALPGERCDGHDFLAQVKEKGARGAVVRKDYQGDGEGLTLYCVPDVLETMHQLASQILLMWSPKVIGITGSVGKTTMKECVATLLEQKYRVAMTFKSYNGQIGVPLTIFNSDHTAEVLVLEMGMNQPGELEKLTLLAQPEIVVMMKIAEAHIAPFGTLEGIAREKATIFKSPILEKAFIHETAFQYPCMQIPSATLFGSGKMPRDFPLRAEHLYENFLGAREVALYLGLSDEEINRGMQHLKPSRHRFERVEIHGLHFIDDSYNANVTSMKAALKSMPNPSGVKRAILGPMVEQGDQAEKMHREVAQFALQHVDELYCYGDEGKYYQNVFQEAGKMAFHFGDKKELARELLKVAHSDDLTLIKASNSYKLWEILDGFS